MTRFGPGLAACILALATAGRVACGDSDGAPRSATPSVQAPGVPQSSAGSPDGPAPSPTRWPGSAIAAVVALGAADNEIWKAGTDLGLSAETEDLQLMWGAADGLARMIEGLTPNVDRLQSFDYTAPLAEKYRAAFPVILQGATMIRDAIGAGDAQAIAEGSLHLADGLRRYAEVRALLAEEDYVEQAIFQQRFLVR